MKSFENGVSFYTYGIAYVPVAFPENEVMCHWCPFCRGEDGLKRFWCRLTNDMIYNPFVPELPDTCPIVFDEKEE